MFSLSWCCSLEHKSLEVWWIPIYLFSLLLLLMLVVSYLRNHWKVFTALQSWIMKTQDGADVEVKNEVFHFNYYEAELEILGHSWTTPMTLCCGSVSGLREMSQEISEMCLEEENTSSSIFSTVRKGCKMGRIIKRNTFLKSHDRMFWWNSDKSQIELS